jgi:hypothetical protein
MDCSGWIPGMIHLDFLISPIGPQESEESSWHMFFLLYFFGLLKQIQGLADL